MWWASPAEWNLWGAKAYSGEEWGSPLKGTSLSLLKRAWLLTYMYGSAFIMGQHSYFEKEKNNLKLSPVGKIFMEEKAFIEGHPDRGVQYVPISMIWGFYEGYVTAKHAPKTSGPYLAWGNIPYTKGHYQIDAVNDAFYPGMAESGYWRNEKGYLGATPCGDQMDVFLDNVSAAVLNRYNATIILGNAKIEGQLLDTLVEFLKKGGSIATSISQITSSAYETFGIKQINGLKTTITAVTADVSFNEAEYIYHLTEINKNAEILVWTAEKEVLAYKLDTGYGGSLLVFLSDYGLTEKVCDIPKDCPVEAILPRPYLLLEHVKNLLFTWCQQWNLVQVRGTHGVQWFTNIDSREDECIVTIVNNESAVWQGDIRFTHREIAQGINWMNDTAISPGKTAELTLRPHDMTILRLRATEPVMHFMEEQPMTNDSNTYNLRSMEIFEDFMTGKRENIAMKQS